MRTVLVPLPLPSCSPRTQCCNHSSLLIHTCLRAFATPPGIEGQRYRIRTQIHSDVEWLMAAVPRGGGAKHCVSRYKLQLSLIDFPWTFA